MSKKPDFTNEVEQVAFNRVCNDLMDGIRRKEALLANGITVQVFRKLLDAPDNQLKYHMALKEYAYSLYENILDLMDDTSILWAQRQLKIQILTKFISFFDKELFSTAPKPNKEDKQPEAMVDKLTSIIQNLHENAKNKNN